MPERKWRVNINRGYTYEVMAAYPAEASSDAVWAWRRDETVPEAVRLGPISYIETEVLESRPRRRR